MNNIELLEKLKKELTPMGITIEENSLSTNIFFQENAFIKIHNNCFSIKSSWEADVYTVSKQSIENGYFSMTKLKSDVILIKFKTENSCFSFKMKAKSLTKKSNTEKDDFNEETNILMLLSDLSAFILLEMNSRTLLSMKREQGIINE